MNCGFTQMQEMNNFVNKVKERLGDGIICERCDCTIHTYAATCPQPSDVDCPGFLAIKNATEKVMEAQVQ